MPIDLIFICLLLSEISLNDVTVRGVIVLRCHRLLLLEVGEDEEAVVSSQKSGIELSSVGGTVGRH